MFCISDVMLSGIKHLCLSIPFHSCTPSIPNIKKTKKLMSRTLPNIGNVSSSSMTNIRKSKNRESTNALSKKTQ